MAGGEEGVAGRVGRQALQDAPDNWDTLAVLVAEGLRVGPEGGVARAKEVNRVPLDRVLKQ